MIRDKPVRTTVSDKAAPCPLDRVDRQFRARAPNMLWVSDFTYVATWVGFVYVASSSTPTPAGSLAGAPVGVRMPASFWMRPSKRCMTDDRCGVAASSTTPTAAANMCRSSTPTALPKPASNHRLAASATATTTLWRNPSTASKRPR